MPAGLRPGPWHRWTRLLRRDHPAARAAGISVEELLERWIHPSRYSSFPVVRPDGMLVGLVTMAHVKRVPVHERGTVTAGQIATPMEQVVICTSDEAVLSVMSRLSRVPEHRALVIDGGRLRGVISPRDIHSCHGTRGIVENLIFLGVV